ncbi:beta-lactamase family protein [Colletotrichum karsti]|uniref:Beta-lactamase family protein n=1 Tax=Colletotrichum karsti TaxID=1095194 RepID=A0A9P6IGC2_9PEZI|nr:beta-lactamase family protein [Colletotrichum karsti]KAF9881531.1 beta-lactamase family protein [Colletotrichum karsti]
MKGATLVEKYFGRTSSIGSDKIDSNSAFWIYSITKTVTAIAVLQCVERGQVQLDDPVYDILPELKQFGVLGYDQQGQISLTPHKERITLRHLLSHTSGVGVDVFDPRLQAWRMSRDEHPQAFSGDSKKAYTIPLLFEPGQGWAYGGGVEWAGILVERLNKMKLGDYMKTHIFDPLGMTSTTFHPDKDLSIQGRLVETSTRISDGTLVPMKGPYPGVTTDDSGAMGLVSTVPDIAKLTTDLLQPTPRLLQSKSVDELFSPQFGPDTPAAGMLAYGAMMYGRLTGEPYDAEKVGQAPGAYFIKKDSAILPGGTLVMTGIPNLVWFVNRDRGVGGLYASAIMPPDDAKSSELIAAFLKEVFHKQ